MGAVHLVPSARCRMMGRRFAGSEDQGDLHRSIPRGLTVAKDARRKPGTSARLGASRTPCGHQVLQERDGFNLGGRTAPRKQDRRCPRRSGTAYPSDPTESAATVIGGRDTRGSGGPAMGIRAFSNPSPARVRRSTSAAKGIVFTMMKRPS
jgi:hypothetical protein